MKRFLFLLLLSRSLCADETKLFELLYKSVSKTADGIEKTITFFESLFYEPGDSEGCGEYFRHERNLAVDTTETASPNKNNPPRRVSIVSDKIKTKIGAIIATATLIGILKYSLDLWKEKQEREEREKAEAKKRAVTPLLTPEQQLHQKLRDLGFSQRAIAMIKRHPQLAQAYDYLPHDVHAAAMQRHIVKQTNNLGRLYVCAANLDGAAEVADLGMSFSAVASTFNRDGYTAQAKVAITGTKFVYGFLKGAANAARQKGKTVLWCLDNLDQVGKNVQNAAVNLRNGICNIADTIASDPEGLLDGGIEQCQSFCSAIARDPIGAVHTVGYTVRALCQETLTRIQVYCATTTEEEFGEDLGHAVADAIIWFAIGRVAGIAGKAVATRTTRALKKLGKYGKTVAKKVGSQAKNSKLGKTAEKILQQYKQAVQKIKKCTPGGTATNTVWDRIVPTQELLLHRCKTGEWCQLPIPKSFILKTKNGDFWVSPNATEHFVEYLVGSKNKMKIITHNLPINSQSYLTSFYRAVEEAAAKEFVNTKLVQIGKWKLVCRQRLEDKLPVIMHANFKFKG